MTKKEEKNAMSAMVPFMFKSIRSNVESANPSSEYLASFQTDQYTGDKARIYRDGELESQASR